MLFYQNLSIPLFNQKVSLEGRFSVKAHACPTRAPTGGGRWMAARAHDAVHGAVHGAFMAMPLYTGIRQGEVHVLGPSVRNGSHRARLVVLYPTGSYSTTILGSLCQQTENEVLFFVGERRLKEGFRGANSTDKGAFVSLRSVLHP